MYRSDNPVIDWEKYNEDTRPVIAQCAQCDCDIYGETSTQHGDDYYIINDDFVCEDCLEEYCKRFLVEG